jgi:hypothetical protein
MAWSVGRIEMNPGTVPPPADPWYTDWRGLSAVPVDWRIYEDPYGIIVEPEGLTQTDPTPDGWTLLSRLENMAQVQNDTALMSAGVTMMMQVTYNVGDINTFFMVPQAESRIMSGGGIQRLYHAATCGIETRLIGGNTSYGEAEGQSYIPAGDFPNFPLVDINGNLIDNEQVVVPPDDSDTKLWSASYYTIGSCQSWAATQSGLARCQVFSTLYDPAVPEPGWPNVGIQSNLLAFMGNQGWLAQTYIAFGAQTEASIFDIWTTKMGWPGLSW